MYSVHHVALRSDLTSKHGNNNCASDISVPWILKCTLYLLDPERQIAREHRCRPLGHVNQKEGSAYWPGHRGAYLSPEGNTLINSVISAALNKLPHQISSCSLLLQVKSPDIFDAWVSKLRHHRLYRQNEIVRSPREATMRTFPPSAIESPQAVSSMRHESKVCVCVGAAT